jgi:NAD-dependent dihydropyrimidine dehydrogenase PreA subunit
MRKIIHIDESLCNGCGECIPNCHEGAIQLVDTPDGQKARLVKESYCDGLGACLGTCPTGALTIVEKEADAFDEAAVEQHLKEQNEPPNTAPDPVEGHVCPGMRVINDRLQQNTPPAVSEHEAPPSELRQWPIQLHLIPVNAPFLQGADLALIADCAAIAYTAVHPEFLRDHAIAMACPKLDNASATIDKLADMLHASGLRSITVLHMQVPCCGGLIHLVQQAMAISGVSIPVRTIQIGIDGEKMAVRHIPAPQPTEAQ